MLAAATPYFHAMFTSGLIESEFQGRWTRGRSAAGPNHRQKSRQKLVLQGIKPKILEVNKHHKHVNNKQTSQRDVNNKQTKIVNNNQTSQRCKQ